MANFLLLFLTLFTSGYLAGNVFLLSINYIRARKISLPIVLRPYDQLNPIGIILGRLVLPFFERLPFGTGSFTRFCRNGFKIREKYHWIDDLGDAFVTVSPAKIWLCIADPNTVSNISRSRTEFDRPMDAMEQLDALGKNVSLVQGAEWQRQRKIISVAFNEQNNRIVFDEAVRQGAGMIEHWTSLPGGAMKDVCEDSKTFTLNVLSAAGFGRTSPFAGSGHSKRSLDNDVVKKSRDNLSLVLNYFVVISLFGPKLLSAPFMPKAASRIGNAVAEFKEYVSSIISEENSLIKQGNSSSSSLVASLLRASEQAGIKEGANASLSESEVLGNTLILHLGGYDTTALSLSTSLVFLAAYPDIQDWISEEIRHVLPNDDRSTWNYPEAFPRLKRCVSILLETLRLYSPVLGFTKVSSTPSTITINNRQHLLPANTFVKFQTTALGTHPRYWGTDSLTWRPTRWIKPTTTGTIGYEELITPVKGTYIPWADGPRVCPGKKFAQVEFVALMCSLFRDHRIDPVVEKGESMKEARERILQVARDQEMYLLQQMRRPKEAKMRWVRRSSRTKDNVDDE